MRNGTDHRADDRGTLVDPIRPRRHDVAGVVVNPLFAVDDTLALETHAPRRAVTDRAVEIERPARTADATLEHPHGRVFDGDVSASELELVEAGRNVRVVQQAAVGPGTDQVADIRVLGHRRPPSRAVGARPNQEPPVSVTTKPLGLLM